MSLGKKFCLVILSLFGLTIIVAAECEDGKHYRNINDCRRFWYCSSGKIIDLPCAEGHYWDANKESCELQLNVNCIPPTTPVATTPSTTTSTTTKLTTTAPPLIECKTFCGHPAGNRHICPESYLGMEWSSAGAIPGKHCTQISEPADIFSWHDNFLCFNNDYGIRWSSAGAISGMNCVGIIESADLHGLFTWRDNFLCVPYGSSFRFQWSSANAIAGLCCIHTYEPADLLSWHDNYLCVSE